MTCVIRVQLQASEPGIIAYAAAEILRGHLVAFPIIKPQKVFFGVGLFGCDHSEEGLNLKELMNGPPKLAHVSYL